MASSSRIPISGLLLIALGGIFLADQLGVMSAGSIIRTWWPAALIVAGLLHLREGPGTPIGPLALLTVGTALLLSNLGVVQLRSVGRLWPIALIAMGLHILMSRGGGGGGRG